MDLLDRFHTACLSDPALVDAKDGDFLEVVNALESDGLTFVADVRLAFSPDEAVFLVGNYGFLQAAWLVRL